MRFTYFLRWYLAFTLVSLMVGFGIATGFFSLVWEADVTKISFLIMFLLFGVSAKCGLDIKQFEQDKIANPRKIEFGWFFSDIFLGLGMIGTIIGFIIVMKDFSTIDFSNLSTIQDLIKNLGSGISTALYTTLFGLVASVLTKLQYFALEDIMEKEGI